MLQQYTANLLRSVHFPIIYFVQVPDTSKIVIFSFSSITNNYFIIVDGRPTSLLLAIHRKNVLAKLIAHDPFTFAQNTKRARTRVQMMIRVKTGWSKIKNAVAWVLWKPR